MTRRRVHLTLAGVLERLAALAGPQRRDLVRAMVSELDAIDDPSERRRFAAGAMIAVLRLGMRRFGRTLTRRPTRFVQLREHVGANSGGTSMSAITSRELIRRHIRPFAVALVAFTVLILSNSAVQQARRLSARGESVGTQLEALSLSIPPVIALTVPMAVFFAVLWVFARLGREGALARVRSERRGLRRLVAPVLAATAVISLLMLVLNDQVLPRTNGRLAAIHVGAPVDVPRAPTDRSMTIGELREAARRARGEDGPNAAARAAAYEVEVQKKLALAASSLFLALAAAAIALRFPRGGVWLVAGASCAIYFGYYVTIVAGEALADQRVVSPVLAMWSANVILLANVALFVWFRGGDSAPPGESLALEG